MLLSKLKVQEVFWALDLVLFFFFFFGAFT